MSPDIVEDLYENLDNQRVCKYLELIKEAESQSFKTIENTTKTL